MRGAEMEMEVEKCFQNHADSVADTTDNSAPWTLATQKSRSLLPYPPSSIATTIRSEEDAKESLAAGWSAC